MYSTSIGTFPYFSSPKVSIEVPYVSLSKKQTCRVDMGPIPPRVRLLKAPHTHFLCASSLILLSRDILWFLSTAAPLQTSRLWKQHTGHRKSPLLIRRFLQLHTKQLLNGNVLNWLMPLYPLFERNILFKDVLGFPSGQVIAQRSPNDWHIHKNKCQFLSKTNCNETGWSQTFSSYIFLKNQGTSSNTLSAGVHRCKNVESYKLTANNFLHIPHIPPLSMFPGELHQSKK